ARAGVLFLAQQRHDGTEPVEEVAEGRDLPVRQPGEAVADQAGHGVDRSRRPGRRGAARGAAAQRTLRANARDAQVAAATARQPRMTRACQTCGSPGWPLTSARDASNA